MLLITLAFTTKQMIQLMSWQSIREFVSSLPKPIKDSKKKEPVPDHILELLDEATANVHHHATVIVKVRKLDIQVVMGSEMNFSSVFERLELTVCYCCGCSSKTYGCKRFCNVFNVFSFLSVSFL
ncbi:hypothetical protein HanRHA438_Chr06g0261991 [Helianthus annuus]|nr:hypothetical protein HanRHA438_Chr06g0261991 [Helianthus annuus]